MLQVNVQGGTGAGRKRPLKMRPKEFWACDCNRVHWTPVNPPHLVRCSRCGKERP